jgi:hypothetical protein
MLMFWAGDDAANIVTQKPKPANVQVLIKRLCMVSPFYLSGRGILNDHPAVQPVNPPSGGFADNIPS